MSTFAIVNSKNELGIDRVSGLELQFESKGAAAFFLTHRVSDIELQGKLRVKELKEVSAE